MESYKEKFVPNADIELIHVSLDLEEPAAASWAKKAKMAWPTILFSDHQKEALTAPYFEGDPEAPSYRLVDATGKVIVKDKTHAFAKINMLKKE
ncbi:MAG: hypothetical protein ACON5H_05390 [Akkermansiaceae bacterium]